MQVASSPVCSLLAGEYACFQLDQTSATQGMLTITCPGLNKDRNEIKHLETLSDWMK